MGKFAVRPGGIQFARGFPLAKSGKTFGGIKRPDDGVWIITASSIQQAFADERVDSVSRNWIMM